MSAENGVEIIKIGRKGRKKFQLGDRPPFEIDVILVQNQWLEIDRGFRDEKDEIPPERNAEANKAAWLFVSELCGTPTTSPDDAESLTMTEALEFLNVLTREGAKLADFFVPKLPEGQSSSGRSTTLHFSE